MTTDALNTAREALRAAGDFIEDEADNRANAGSEMSDYEREPRELLERIDAALAALSAAEAPPAQTGADWTEEQVGSAWDEAWAIYAKHQGGDPGDERRGREAACRYLLATLNASPPAQTSTASEQAGEAVRKAIEELLEAANRVYRHGNNPGTQWKALSTAIDSARQALAALSRGDAAASVEPEEDDTSAEGCPVLTLEPGVICDACDCWKRHEAERIAHHPDAGAPSREAIREALWDVVNEVRTSKVLADEPSAMLQRELLRDMVDDGVKAIRALYPTPPALKASELGEDQKRRAVPLSTISEGWRPIDENTPKGHSQLLGFVDGEVRVIKWTKTSHVPLWGWCLVDQGPEDCDLCSPTHWMPLPAPPAPAQNAEGGES